MNTRSFYFSIMGRAFATCASVSLLVFANGASGAEKTNAPASAPQSATNPGAKPAPIEIPLSQFAIPSTPAEGRNPFFPDSMIGKPVANPTNPTVKVAVTLVLNGTSKVGTKRFALINGRTFEAGEDGDVTVGGKKIHILCISIKDDGVTIEADGSRQELKLKTY